MNVTSATILQLHFHILKVNWFISGATSTNLLMTNMGTGPIVQQKKDVGSHWVVIHMNIQSGHVTASKYSKDL